MINKHILYHDNMFTVEESNIFMLQPQEACIYLNDKNVIFLWILSLKGHILYKIEISIKYVNIL